MSMQSDHAFDVVVVGGGMGGVSAATAAAEAGAATLLVEGSGQFGGVGTNSLISRFSQRPLPGVYKPTLVERLEEDLRRTGALQDAQFSTDEMVLLLDQWVADSGVTPLLHTSMIGVKTTGRRVDSVRLFNKSGQFDVHAKLFIDATGDGDLCHMAGAEFELGDGETSYGQPMTFAFFMAGVDQDRMPAWDEINRLYEAARESGEVSNPRENVLAFQAVEPGTLQFNTTRILHRDGTDGWSLSAATLEGRAQVREMVRFLKTLPGFENAYLARLASRIGVRETRRFVCEYHFTVDDMLASRRFPDGVMATAAHLDVHNPHGSGTRYEALPEGTHYEVPLRTLIPRDLDNVAIASRCLSASHEAFSAIRMMPHVAEYGRSVGLAAARQTRRNEDLREVDVRWVRRELGTLAASDCDPGKPLAEQPLTLRELIDQEQITPSHA